jgi:hypothetical protein
MGMLTQVFDNEVFNWYEVPVGDKLLLKLLNVKHGMQS